MKNKPNEERDRTIADQRDQGLSIDVLAKVHFLTESRIAAIVIDERNRRQFSALPYYRKWRTAE